MNRSLKCIKFESQFLIKSLLVFLCYYFGIYIVISLAMYFAGHSKNVNVNSAFYMAGSIFAFIVATSSYRPIYNNLLMFGNTRRRVILSCFATFAGFSVVLALLTVFSDLFDHTMTRIFNFQSILNSLGLLGLLYNSQAGIVPTFLWYLAFFIMLLTFSLLYGTLSYKFGKVFQIVFWVGFAAFFMLGPEPVVNFVKAVFMFGTAKGLLLAPLNFLVFSLIFGIGSYVLATKQNVA